MSILIGWVKTYDIAHSFITFLGFGLYVSTKVERKEQVF